VTLSETGGSPVVTVIYPGHLREWYQRIALIETPSAVITYLVEHERDATDLVNASDEFPVPVRFAQAVLARAEAYEHKTRADTTRYTMAMTEYQRRMGLLNSYLTSGPDQVYIPGGQVPAPSVLPSNYPWTGYGR
jgi:hypothetical protein